MGTRGLWGIRKNNVDKAAYNHYDSYPSYLGYKIIDFVKAHTTDELSNIFENIILVNEDDKPNLEQIEECSAYLNLEVSNRDATDWYCLLRGAQGKPEEYAKGLKYMADYIDFIKDSLFCEFAYLINLDNETLEYWVGYQKKPDAMNRYGTENPDKFYPCKLLKAYDLQYVWEAESKGIVDEMFKLARDDKE